MHSTSASAPLTMRMLTWLMTKGTANTTSTAIAARFKRSHRTSRNAKPSAPVCDFLSVSLFIPMEICSVPTKKERLGYPTATHSTNFCISNRTNITASPRAIQLTILLSSTNPLSLTTVLNTSRPADCSSIHRLTPPLNSVPQLGPITQLSAANRVANFGVRNW